MRYISSFRTPIDLAQQPGKQPSKLYEDEIRISLNWVLGIQILAALALFLAGEGLLWIPDRSVVRSVALILLCTALIAWLIHSRMATAGHWFNVAALVSTCCLISTWWNAPGALCLLAIPVALAAVLIGFTAAAGTAMVSSAAVLLLASITRGPEDFGIAAFPLVTIWAILGILALAFHAINQRAHWLWSHYVEARELLEADRKQKVDLAQALEDLAHANRQLALLNERTTMLRQIAEVAQKAKAIFVAKVSHEFRTPLNMIIGLTDLLMETPEIYGESLPATLFEDIRIVNRNCEYLAGLINDVLDLSRTEAGQLTLHRDWVNLAEDIEEALTVVRPLIEKKQLRLRLAIPQALPKVYCDRTRIRQVILNLAGNAARYTDRGEIAIEVMQEDSAVVVSVIDSGPGIAPEDRVRIFEPFYRGRNSATSDQSGSGLGLSISRQFIELHGGQIWVTSTPGAGSVFSFRLPIQPPPPPVPGPSLWIMEDWIWRQRSQPRRIDHGPYKPRIVVCDATGQLFPMCSRYTDEVEFVDTRDWDQAMKELRQAPPHAIVLNAAPDEALPSLIKEAASQAPDTPIIACTMVSPADRVHQAEVAGYLVKPVLANDLCVAIRATGAQAKRILIAEDSPDMRQLLSRMLSAHFPNVEVVTASSSTECLDMLHAHRPDLMLLDLVMPDTDGWQLLDRKRHDLSIRDIPVVVVSAQDPMQQPAMTKLMVVAMGEGLALDKLLRNTLSVSASMLRPERQSDQAPG